MSDLILEEITRENIIDAIQEFDTGIEHQFGKSTGYDVLFEGRRYPPKAIVGIAAKYVINKQLGPYDFKGGLKSKCFRVLKDNQFEVVTKGESTKLFPEEIDETETHTEGSVTQIVVNRYERDRDARAKCVKEYGAICLVCSMDFEKKYGTIGEGFIHVHHIRRLSDIGEEYKVDPLTDLVPVCPNCHAMLHKRRPPYSIEELQKILRDNENS